MWQFVFAACVTFNNSSQKTLPNPRRQFHLQNSTKLKGASVAKKAPLYFTNICSDISLQNLGCNNSQLLYICTFAPNTVHQKRFEQHKAVRKMMVKLAPGHYYFTFVWVLKKYYSYLLFVRYFAFIQVNKINGEVMNWLHAVVHWSISVEGHTRKINEWIRLLDEQQQKAFFLLSRY